MQLASSHASIDSIASVAFSRLVELEESLREVHARQRLVLRDTATLETRLRALLYCEGYDRKKQSSKVRELASSGMSKSS